MNIETEKKVEVLREMNGYCVINALPETAPTSDHGMKARPGSWQNSSSDGSWKVFP